MKLRYIIPLVIILMNNILGFAQDAEDQISIVPANFPTDYIVKEYCPSCETPDSLIFYPDRTFIISLGGIEEHQKHYELGIWKKEGNLIKIDIYKKIGIRPIGEPTNPEVSYADNPDDYFVYNEYVPYEEWISKTRIFDIESLSNFDIAIDTCNKATQITIDVPKYLIKGNYKIASCRLLKKEDLECLTQRDLRLMRNEIFARYHYEFKSPDLQKYFLNQKWYRGYTTHVDRFLTDIEKKNIKLITDLENK
ncbi:YARHG domain-containing protein [Plebeiibacterium sediminum]|uniref:YARHG domain-containing protein n=1 Tax=Plebeiibacterium sediminum TaxID=2992112 RepID=A0AAE3M4M7_9BACT|nr:YARHG domain-containing protein [Plebeiobacterium sediminum]MCW3786891.1 YARHG domain-containing protein [Plebeiobacterium sediminum]